MGSRSIRALLVATVLAVAGCGGGGVQPPPPDMTPVSPPDLWTKMCPSSCTSHQQCATGCAAAPVGANCCDMITNTCYVVATAQCPAPPVDMSMVSPY
jgi:hypothetical protein